MTGFERFIDPLRVGPEMLAVGSGEGSLAGVSFAVKDIIDVAGVPTGVGNPDFLAAAGPAVRHAEAVIRLLDAGARVIGKAHTDEFAYSLSGTNAHYGTPRNPAAPRPRAGRVLVGLGGGGCRRRGGTRNRQRHRRLDPGAGVLLRHIRPATQPRPGADDGDLAARAVV